MNAQTLDRTFNALANHQRREILRHLADGPLPTPALGQRIPVSKQALNKHIVILEDAGLLERTKSGRVKYLRLTSAPLDGPREWIDVVCRGWETNLDRLGQILEELP